jgi:hypothetical protein
VEEKELVGFIKRYNNTYGTPEFYNVVREYEERKLHLESQKISCMKHFLKTGEYKCLE